MPLREDFRLPVRHGYAVCAAHGVWRSLVARFVRDEEVVGSNPATPTIQWSPSQMAAASRWNRATRPGGLDSTPFECGYFVVTLRPRSSRAGPASSRRRWRSRPDVLVQAGRRPVDPGLEREADARGPDEPGPGRDVRAVRVRGAVRRLDTPAGRQSATTVIGAVSARIRAVSARLRRSKQPVGDAAAPTRLGDDADRADAGVQIAVAVAVAPP